MKKIIFVTSFMAVISLGFYGIVRAAEYLNLNVSEPAYLTTNADGPKVYRFKDASNGTVCYVVEGKGTAVSCSQGSEPVLGSATQNSTQNTITTSPSSTALPPGCRMEYSTRSKTYVKVCTDR
jgi:hypothetical protein